MKINFKQAALIEQFAECIYDNFSIPKYITYSWLTKQSFDKGLETQISNYISQIQMRGEALGVELQNYQISLKKNKQQNQEAFDKYIKFKAYYQKTLETFQLEYAENN